MHALCTEAGLEAEVAQQLEVEEITVVILLSASLVERREILRSMGLRFGQIMSLNQALGRREEISARTSSSADSSGVVVEEEEEEEEEEEQEEQEEDP